jgi:iron complex outermembrane receptor protein
MKSHPTHKAAIARHGFAILAIAILLNFLVVRISLAQEEPVDRPLLSAATPPSPATPDDLSKLKKMSFEDLTNVEVTSVSRKEEKWLEAASAIQVITSEDIRRSGATSIPEALRLASNLHVAQVNSSQWAISARGFNNVLANKLLVMIDGRVVYTPLYAGVFWDVQDVLLEDIERIEVVSGPGGTLWGANAVNGVINIITKDTRDTAGFLLEGGVGTELPGFGSLRYGGELTPDLHYRIQARGIRHNDTVQLNGLPAQDSWALSQGGFRLDWNPRGKDRLTFKGDIYDGNPNPEANATGVIVSGGNVLANWTRKISDSADFQLHFYYDRTWRDFGAGLKEKLTTYSFDWQNHFRVGQRQDLVWGLNYRLMDHDTQNLTLLKFLPANKTHAVSGAFIQDEITLVDRRLRVTLGSKFTHNAYTGFEVQPSARLKWTIKQSQTVWGAISRAVRTPSRIDGEFFLFANPTFPVISGNSDFRSEELVAYELGWRSQPTANLSLSLASFYNRYDNIRSAQPGPPPFGLPITFHNAVRGEAYGLEVSGIYQVNHWWRLRGGYTLFRKHLEVKPNEVDLNRATAESNDPKNQFQVQSTMDLPGRLELSASLRYVGALPRPAVPGYVGLDSRLGWRATSNLELSLVGQNLIGDEHLEFIPASPARRQVERGVYGKVTWRF